MHKVARYLLRQQLSSTSVSSAKRHLSVLSTVEWNNSDRCQFINSRPQTPPFLLQQVRFRRHDRASAFAKPRPKTKKQRQTYNRKIKRIEEEKAKHNPPGFRAGPRRQFIRERWQQLLDTASDTDGKELALSGADEYGIGDALMEDLLGNTAHLTSQPTPEPVYLGHMHKKYYNIVADQMDRYKEAVEARSKPAEDGTKSGAEVLDLSTGAASLPSDESISKVLRAYRDRHGTRSRPIGIAMALEHLLKDLGVPIVAFGEYTYTTLMTCCRTPIEARRIMKLMNDQQHSISAYSWSILVDIHAKLGEFEECTSIIKEMALEGIPPTQAAYTSLMAACYKVCNDGRIPHAVRAKAGEVGWNHWQEMRIVGIEADAMAYGAIIRLCAARGQAERAINMLEEMNRFEVRPTTLCFSSALRAVARSHEIGVRFERGSSRKQLRRELFAAHHGKMARQIVIMAENAEVEQDDGFVSALILCAAAAGDSATAKAVYLASEVRRMDHLRTIGPDSSLRILRGEAPLPSRHVDSMSESRNDVLQIPVGGKTALQELDGPPEAFGVQVKKNQKYEIESFGQREYGTDTRPLSALLRSSGQSMNSNGLGTMWAGKTNQGYLCENSLRLITTRREPVYTKSSIPDEISSKVGISSLRRYDENDPEEPRKKGAARQKFRGMFLDDDSEEVLADYADMYGETTLDEQFDVQLEAMRSNGEPGSVKDLTSTTFTDGTQPTSTKVEMPSFDVFLQELREEAKAEGLTEEISEEDAKELFLMLQDEFSEPTEEFEHVPRSMDEMQQSELVDRGLISQTDGSSNSIASTMPIVHRQSDQCNTDRTSPANGTDAAPEAPSSAMFQLDGLDPSQLETFLDLKAALPGMPISRLKRVIASFESTLGYPSLLSLVPILRESLPDNLSIGHLRRMNIRNADFVMRKAEDNGIVDESLLNAMLQVKTNASSLDDAINFHQEEFRRNNLRPNAYSDRLVLQMLISNHRLPRALEIKRRIEEDKRTLDLPSYGTLVDYFARHNHLGSAMMTLKECLARHGSKPSEKYLNSTRLLARKLNMENELGLTSLIGQDPIEWLKHGERHLKREKSKKGRRNVHLAYNSILG